MLRGVAAQLMQRSTLDWRCRLILRRGGRRLVLLPGKGAIAVGSPVELPALLCRSVLLLPPLPLLLLLLLLLLSVLLLLLLHVLPSGVRNLCRRSLHPMLLPHCSRCMAHLPLLLPLPQHLPLQC